MSKTLDITDDSVGGKLAQAAETLDGIVNLIERMKENLHTAPVTRAELEALQTAVRASRDMFDNLWDATDD